MTQNVPLPFTLSKKTNILDTVFVNPLRFTDRRTWTLRSRTFGDEETLRREYLCG